MANGGSQPVTIINNFGGAEEMTGATSGADGTGGTVPAPVAGDEGKFLRGDATWQEAGGGEASPGPFINIFVPDEIGASSGAAITVTPVTAFSGFIEIVTGTSVTPGNPAFRIFRGDYTTPGADYIPVQLTPADSTTKDLAWWPIMGDSRLTILATNFQAESAYKFAYRLN